MGSVKFRLTVSRDEFCFYARAFSDKNGEGRVCLFQLLVRAEHEVSAEIVAWGGANERAGF